MVVGLHCELWRDRGAGRAGPRGLHTYPTWLCLAVRGKLALRGCCSGFPVFSAVLVIRAGGSSQRAQGTFARLPGGSHPSHDPTVLAGLGTDGGSQGERGEWAPQVLQQALSGCCEAWGQAGAGAGLSAALAGKLVSTRVWVCGRVCVRDYIFYIMLTEGSLTGLGDLCNWERATEHLWAHVPIC